MAPTMHGLTLILCVIAALALQCERSEAFQVTMPAGSSAVSIRHCKLGAPAHAFSPPRRLPSVSASTRRSALALRAVSVDPDDERIKKLARALESIGMNPEDSVAMFDYDSSEQAILLGYAVVTSQGQPIVQTPDVEHADLVAAYKDNTCVGVITPDEASMKKLMDGDGSLTLQSCCGFDPASPVGPRFCVVMSTDKSPEQLQEELGCLGREEDPETGLSFQVGLPVECHSFDTLLALVD